MCSRGRETDNGNMWSVYRATQINDKAQAKQKGNGKMSSSMGKRRDPSVSLINLTLGLRI